MSWLKQCGLTFHQVERCIEIARLMEGRSGMERKLAEARLLGMIEGLGLGWRRDGEVVSVVHVCEIMHVPWKHVGGKVLWGNEALERDDPRREVAEQRKGFPRDFDPEKTDIFVVLNAIGDKERVDSDLVSKLKAEVKEREKQNRRRLPFE